MDLLLAKTAHVPHAPNASNNSCVREKSPTLWNPRHFREEAAPYHVEPATARDLAATHKLAEELVGVRLAPLSALVAAHRHTGASAWVHRGGDALAITGVLLMLPLTSAGEAALLSDQFDASNPHPEHLCVPGDAVSAMYIWFTGGRGLRARSAVMRTALAWRDGLYKSLRVYSRAATADGARVLANPCFIPLEQSRGGLLLCDARR